MRRLLTIFLFVAIAWSAVASTPQKLQFIADDYAKARIEANARKVPLFIEVWASW